MTETPKSCADRITEAHATGHLFVHMFEHKFSQQPNVLGSQTEDLFEVMANNPLASYSNAYHDYEMSHEGYGAIGLAATALHKDYPIKTFTNLNHIGILMDTAKPLIVSGMDHYSATTPQYIRFARTAGDDEDEIWNAQGIPRSQDGWVQQPKTEQDLTAPGIVEQLAERGEQGLAKLWEIIKRHGWSKYCQRQLRDPLRDTPMNEVNVAASLGDICGIVVCSRGFHVDPKDVHRACQVRDYLLGRYPEIVPADLPIVHYKREVKPVLVEIPKHEIQEIIQRESGRSFS